LLNGGHNNCKKLISSVKHRSSRVTAASCGRVSKFPSRSSLLSLIRPVRR